MWARIKFVINVTLVAVTCRRMIVAWISNKPGRTVRMNTIPRAKEL